MATLIWIGGTSTDSTVVGNWKDQSTGSAPSSIATTDDFLFNIEGAGNPCLFKQATIATLTTATGWNSTITFDNPTLSLTALNFLADSEIAFSNSSTVFTFNGNHITTTPFFNHPVVFGGNITYSGSNGRETVSWVFNNNNSDPSFLCDGLYPKITINSIFTTDVSSNVSNTTTGKVECISLTMTSTGKFTNTNLSAASTQKHIHITSASLATQQLNIENDVFDMRNAKLTLTAANSLKIPCTNDTTNYSGSKPTFFANLGDVVLATGASSGLKMFIPNGLTLECNSLEIQNGVFLLGGEEPNASSEIHLVKKPKVRGTWNFKPITDGIYRSFGRPSQSMFALTAKEAHITDKLTVDGLIDPTGLELTPVSANPGGVAANTLWLNSGDSNKLYHGSSEVAGGGGGTVDAASVQAAGALMDSEVVNLADVKAFNPAAFATAAQGALADTSLQDPAAFATAAQGVKADSAQQPPSEGPFVNGDKTKLDSLASPFEHVRLALTNNSLASQGSGTNYYLELANTSDFSNTGNTTNIVATNDTQDYVLLKAGGMYMVVVSVEMFTSSGTAAQDFWLQLGNGTSTNAERRHWGTARRKVKATNVNADCAWNAQKTVIIDVASGGSDEKLYVIPYVNGVSFTVRAFDNNRTNITITRIGVSTS